MDARMRHIAAWQLGIQGKNYHCRPLAMDSFPGSDFGGGGPEMIAQRHATLLLDLRSESIHIVLVMPSVFYAEISRETKDGPAQGLRSRGAVVRDKLVFQVARRP
jgi:hypothetical protein